MEGNGRFASPRIPFQPKAFARLQVDFDRRIFKRTIGSQPFDMNLKFQDGPRLGAGNEIVDGFVFAGLGFLALVRAFRPPIISRLEMFGCLRCLRAVSEEYLRLGAWIGLLKPAFLEVLESRPPSGIQVLMCRRAVAYARVPRLDRMLLVCIPDLGACQ